MYYVIVYNNKVFFRNKKYQKFVELGADSVYLPDKKALDSPVSIPYKEIIKIEVVDVKNHQVANIYSLNDESKIIAYSFESTATFINFLLALERRRYGRYDD